nr:MAG TPA: hypothetical protein [Caudoviricetes sp.]
MFACTIDSFVNLTGFLEEELEKVPLFLCSFR